MSVKELFRQQAEMSAKRVQARLVADNIHVKPIQHSIHAACLQNKSHVKIGSRLLENNEYTRKHLGGDPFRLRGRY